LTADVKKFFHPHPFPLEGGETLPQLEVAYHTYGNLNADRDNVIWVFHALTANSDAADWWSGLVGPGRLFDPERYFIVCANVVGSCYGSSGPLSTNLLTGQPYYSDFPPVTTRDMVRAHQLLREHLGIRKIYLGLGGSIGGQQAVEWAISEPELFQRVSLIATNARHSAWGIAFNETQRMAIACDPTWRDHDPEAGKKGLMAARANAILSYRNYPTFALTQTDETGKLDDFRASSYQNYQGLKLARRFNTYAYWLLTKSMDSHDVGRHRGSTAEALGLMEAETLVVGISSDILFPVSEQKFLAEHIPRAVYHEIDSTYGHDGFLIEFEQLTNIIKDFISTVNA
jgi:homoserine O-acetyltransferase